MPQRPIPMPLRWVAFVALGTAQPAPAGLLPSVSIGPFISDATPSSIELSYSTVAGCDVHVRARTRSRRAVPARESSSSGGGVSVRHEVLEFDPGSDPLESVALVENCANGRSNGLRLEGLHRIPADPSAPLRFSVIADSQGEAGKAAWILPAIDSARSDFVIHAGDVVEHGERAEEWSAWFDAMSGLVSTRFVATAIGNHDYDQYSENAPDGWRTRQTSGIWDALTQGRRWRALDYPQARIFLLDSNLHSMSEAKWREQLAWLRTELAREDRLGRLKIAVFHHPPFANSVHNWDRIRLNEHQPHEYARLRTELVPLLEQGGVRMVFNGHAHHYERSLKSGVTYVTAGAVNTYRLLPGMPDPLEVNPYGKVLVDLEWTITHCELRPSEGSLSCETFDPEGLRLDGFAVQ